jgi:preprotein translocase subunit SecA
MQTPEHFKVSADREVWITPAGEAYLDSAAKSLEGVWKSSLWRRELMQKALTALWSFHRDQHYIVADNKVQIVDEFTGRVMPDRSWESGLHQMIETKEHCEITGQRRTLSRMTYQRFFRRYLLLGGMTGTAAEVRHELSRVYNLAVQTVPTNRPSQRKRYENICFTTADQRWKQVVLSACELSAKGRAVLIGTRSVEASERIAIELNALAIEHTVLNARQDKAEADIIAAAGQPGRITVATNMAGRGTDIHLQDVVKAAGGLHVILTEFHESSRIDRQLFGRAARQGEPGSVQAIVSLEDELFSRYVKRLQATAGTIVKTRIPAVATRALVTAAQIVAERRNVKIRMATLKEDRKLQSHLSFAGTPN